MNDETTSTDVKGVGDAEVDKRTASYPASEGISPEGSIPGDPKAANRDDASDGLAAEQSESDSLRRAEQ